MPQIPSPIPPADSKSQFVFGNARFTIITSGCIRMEYAPRHGFVDLPTLFAADREARWENARIIVGNESLVIDTGTLRLQYRPDGSPFSVKNLSVVFQNSDEAVTWTPESKNAGNLGGPVPTLDGWSGPRELPEGLLSRDGWYLLDDSGTPLLRDGWVEQRPGGMGPLAKDQKEYAVNADLDWYLFAYGTDYKSALRALAALGGKVPMPRRHVFGSWYCRWHPYTAEQFREIVAGYKEHGFPLDILVMDMDWHTQKEARTGFGHARNLGWTGYTWDRELIPEPEALLRELKEDGIFVTLNDHPCDGMREHEEHYADFIQKLPECTRANPPFDAGDRRYMDAFFQSAHEPLEDMGVDFWWLDWQQNHIYNAVHGVPGLKHLPWLNHLYYRHSLRGGKRGQAFSRWGGWGDHRNPIQFSGDTTSTWEMLAFQIPFTAGSGNSGCFFWAHDLGGFYGDRDPEMFTRWVQFGALSPSLRLHSCGDHLDRRPWLWGERFETAMRTAYELRAALIPYIYTSVRQCHDRTLPLVRPMYLEYPDCPEAYENPQQYLFGDTLLAAPVAAPGSGENLVATQKVWFPEGTWYNVLSHEKFEGGQTVTVQAALDEIPVFAKAGVPIPLQPVTQRMTTTPLTTLIVRCYPGISGVSGNTTLYEDDGQTQGYLSGAFAATDLSYERVGGTVAIKIGAARGTYDGQPLERAYEIELPGTGAFAEATVGGQSIPVEFDSKPGLRKIVIPARPVTKPVEVVVKGA